MGPHPAPPVWVAGEDAGEPLPEVFQTPIWRGAGAPPVGLNRSGRANGQSVVRRVGGADVRANNTRRLAAGTRHPKEVDEGFRQCPWHNSTGDPADHELR
jgi:hypothetical protein